MEQIIIQYGEKQGHIPELLRSQGEEITIGRSFKNQLVINDDYIAPEQLRIFQQEDNWWVEVLDHTNSILLNGKAVTFLQSDTNKSIFQISSGDTLTAGRTTLSIFSPEHKVEKTRKLLTRKLHQDSIGVLLPIILLVAFSLFDISLEHFFVTPQESTTVFATTALISAIMILFWAGIWAFIGRIFRNNSHFYQQILSTTLIFFCVSFVDYWPGLIAFNFSSLLTETVLNYALAFFTLALLLKFNLLFSTNLRRTGLVASLTSGILVGGIGGYQIYKQDEFSYQARYSKTVKPHFLHLGNDSSLNSYMDKVQFELDSFDNLSDANLSPINKAKD